MSFFFFHYSHLNPLTLLFDRATTRQARQATNYASIIIFYTIFRFTPNKNAIPYYLSTVTAKQNSTPAQAVLLFNAINKKRTLSSVHDRNNNANRNLYALSYIAETWG